MTKDYSDSNQSVVCCVLCGRVCSSSIFCFSIDKLVEPSKPSLLYREFLVTWSEIKEIFFLFVLKPLSTVRKVKRKLIFLLMTDELCLLEG